MNTKVLSVVAAMSLATVFIGCGGGSSGGVNTASLSKTVTVGNAKVTSSPTSNNIQKDGYAYTDTTNGITVLVPVSTPEKIKADDLVNDFESVDTGTNTLIVSEKIAKKPISSSDDIVKIVPSFDPKLPWDVSVGVTNYRSLLAIPNIIELLKKNLSPISLVSSDIEFYNSNGDRMWYPNDTLNENNASASFYIMFDKNKSDLNVSKSYTLAYYNNGKYTTKNINIIDKGDGNATIALNGVYPFVIAQKGGVETTTSQIKSDFEKTSFNIPVVSLDEKGNIVGVGNLDDTNVTIYNISKPSKYAFISYILKDGKLETNELNTTITKDDLNPAYPLYDTLTNEDKAHLSSGFYYAKQLSSLDLNDALYPENYYCNKNYYPQEICEDFKSTVVSMFDGDANDNLKDTYTGDSNCTVLSKTISNDSLKVKIKCYDSTNKDSQGTLDLSIDNMKDYFKINYTDSGTLVSFDYTNNTHDTGSFKLYNVSSKSALSRRLDDLVYDYSENSDTYTATLHSVTTYSKLNAKDVYNLTQNGSINASYSYNDDNNKTVSENSSYGFIITQKVYNSTDEASNDLYKYYACELNNISISGDKDDNISINGKKFIFTKKIDNNGAIQNYVNMSKSPIQ